MPTLSVPDEHSNGLAQIVALSDEDVNKISTALAEAKTTKSRELTDLAVQFSPALSIKGAREVVETLRAT